MTIPDHILLVISFRQALYYNKALWSKNFTPSRLSRPWQLTMLKEIQGPFSCHWRNFWHGLWLFGKLTFWKTASACIAVYSLTYSAFKPWTTKVETSNIFLFSLCPLEGELKRNATLCVWVCAVPMWYMCGIWADMDVATWSFCSAVGHALDVVVTDKNTGTATV